MPDSNELSTYFAERIKLIDEALDRWLPAEQQQPTRLHQAMRYSVFAGGKRIRPILMLAACEAVGGDAQDALSAACAIEMIHTYSLIHDDLPAMDDDDLRRGQPTNHKVFGEAVAILAGDALLTEAFVMLSRQQSWGHAGRQVLELMARNAGARGMVGGQVVDMDSEDSEVDLETLEYIHNHKTGALLSAAIEAGALIGGATEIQFDALRRYGKAAGLAFQVADDILDIVADQEALGKDVGSDVDRGKATYPALLGLEGAKLRADELMTEALNAVEGFDRKAQPLRDIARYIVERSF